MATASEILAKVNDLLDGYSDMLAPDGGSKILTLDRDAGSDVALSRLREDGSERWRYGMLAGEDDFVVQWSTDGSELNFTDRLRIDGASGAVTIAGLALDAVDINGGSIDGAVIGGTTPAAGTFTAINLTGTAPVINFSDTDSSVTGQIGSGTSDFNIASNVSIDLRPNNVRAGFISNTAWQFFASEAEVARLTSAGLGIGTSAVGAAIDIAKGTASTVRLRNASGSIGYQIRTNVSDVLDYGFLIEDLAGTDLYLLLAGAAGYHSWLINGAEGQRLTSVGLGIGTLSPTQKLDVVGRILSSSSKTDALAKQGLFGTSHYSTSEEPFYGVHCYSSSSGNVLYLGGGTSSGNSATSISFVTAANNTTLTGTEAMRVDGAGNLLIGTTATGGSKLRVSGLPTSAAGLSAGDVWNDSGTLKIAA